MTASPARPKNVQVSWSPAGLIAPGSGELMSIGPPSGNCVIVPLMTDRSAVDLDGPGVDVDAVEIERLEAVHQHRIDVERIGPSGALAD